MDQPTFYLVSDMIAELKRIRCRLPEQATLYMGEYSVVACQAFLAGFHTACEFIGVVSDPSIWRYVARQRGWDGPAPRLLGQMQERGLTEGQVIDELFALHIEALRFVARPPTDWATLLLETT